MASTEAPNYMETPLATWVQTFANVGDSISYDSLVDGTFLYYVMAQIEPRTKVDHVIQKCDDNKDRAHNWDLLMKNIRLYYEDVLQLYIVMEPPDLLNIVKEPHSSKAHIEMNKVLLLLLGCAVQCENKGHFIENIKCLELETQHAMVEFIQEITDESRNTYPVDLPEGNPADMDGQCKILHHHLKRLLHQRDSYVEEIRDLVQAADVLQGQVDACAQKAVVGAIINGGSPATTEKHHLGVELADLKARMRRMRQELEEKTELAQELKDELEEHNNILTKLRNENLSLTQDARAARTYRDEIDVLNQKVARADKLEAENTKYKEKLNELEFYKARVEELRDDNMVLVESKMMLEEQMASSHKRIETVVELENEIMKYRQQVEEFSALRDDDREKIQELANENARLEHEMKSSMNESATLEYELRKAHKQDSSGFGDSLSDQLRETANNRILRLELDNQRLAKELSELNDKAVLENSSRQLELEKENQRLAKKVSNLQESGSKEAEKIEWLEEQTIQLSRDREQMRRTMDTIRDNNERQVQELVTENEQLTRTIDTLRERGEKSQDLRYKDMDSENKRLGDNVRELSAKISRLDCDNRQLKTAQVRLSADVERLRDVEQEKCSVENRCGELEQTISALQANSEQCDLLEQQITDLEIENHKLSKTVENLKNSLVKLNDLEEKNVTLTVENQKLQRTLTCVKSSSSKLGDLESEKEELNQEIQTLKRSLELQKVEKSKYAQLELDLIDLDNENKKLQKNIQGLNRKVEDAQFENEELEAENRKLGQSLESLRSSMKKFNDIEKDNRELDLENQNLQRENSQHEKENKRLRDLVSTKETWIDENSCKVADLEREVKVLSKSVERSKEVAAKLKEVEKENRDLLQQMTSEKKTFSALREDLVNEKLKTQQLNNELEKLSQELEKIGLNKEQLVATEQALQGENRYKALEGMLEQAFQKSLEMKEEKIHSLESRLEESMGRNQKVQTELKLMKRKYEGLRQQMDEDGKLVNDDATEARTPLPQQPHDGKPNRVVTEVNLRTSRNSSAREILGVQERLVDVERMNATLTTENKILKTQTEDLHKRISSMESQTNHLHVQLSSAQQQFNSAQMDNAKLQVSTTLLHSDNNNLQAQNAGLKSQLSHLESDHEQIIASHDELQGAHEGLVSDHEALQTIHEQLSSEYEALISEHGSLKSVHKALKTEFKGLSNKFHDLERHQDSIALLQESIQQDRDKLRKEAMSLGSLQADYINLKDENSRLQQSNQKLNNDYKDFLMEYKSIKNEYNNMQLKYTQLQGDFNEVRDQLNTMDVELTKMVNKIESLSGMNCQLEEENRELMLQLQALLSQNQDLLTQALHNREQFHEDELAYRERLADLRRQKEKLEEKIMEQYKRYDPSPKKNRGFGANLVRKAKGLISRKDRGRRSETPVTSPDNSTSTESPSGADALSLAHLKEKRSTSSAGLLSTKHGHYDGQRKMSLPPTDSRIRVADSSDGLRFGRQGRGLSSSTTGLNLLSSAAGHETENGGFKLRGFKSSDNLLSKFDSRGSDWKLTDADSVSSSANSATKPEKTDGGKDRLSQRSNSTDSSDATQRHKRVLGGSLSVYDRTPEYSPIDGSTTPRNLTLSEFLAESNNNSPAIQQKSRDQVDGVNLSRDSHNSLTSSGADSLSKQAVGRQASTPIFSRYHDNNDKLPYQSVQVSSPRDLSTYNGAGVNASVNTVYTSSLHQSSAISGLDEYKTVMTSAYIAPSNVNSVTPYSATNITPPAPVYADVSGGTHSPYVKQFASVTPPNPASRRTSMGHSILQVTSPDYDITSPNSMSNSPMSSVTGSQISDVNSGQPAPPIRNYRHQESQRPASAVLGDFRASVTSQDGTNSNPPVVRRRRQRPQSQFVEQDENSTSSVQLVRHPHSQERHPQSQDRLPHSQGRQQYEVARVQHERPATVAAEPIRYSGQNDVRYIHDRSLPSATSSDSTFSSEIHLNLQRQYSASPAPAAGTGTNGPVTGTLAQYEVRRRHKPPSDEGYNTAERRQRAAASSSDSSRKSDPGSGIIMRQSSREAVVPPVPARAYRNGASNPNLLDDTVVARRSRQTATLPVRPKSVMADPSNPAPPRATVKPYTATMMPRPASTDLLKSSQAEPALNATPPANGQTKPPGKKPVCNPPSEAESEPRRPPRRRPQTSSPA